MKRPIRIGLIAEGEAELGPSVPYIKPQDGGKALNCSQEGALHTLIRRELISAGHLDCKFVQRRPTTKEARKGKHRTGHGILDRKYLAQTILAWQPDEIDIVIILVDADDIAAQRIRALDRAAEIVRRYHLDRDGQPILNRNASGLAIKNFDTWSLADGDQIWTLLGVALPDDLPQDLETLPGDNLSERLAKTILDSAIDQSKYLVVEKEGLRRLKIRWELAEVVDTVQIKARCQNGYKAFIEAVNEAANQVQVSDQR